jgi:hypothetical protein
VDSIFAAIKPLGVAAVAFFVVKARKLILEYLPGAVQTLLASRLDEYLTQIAMKAVEAAEERGERAAKLGVTKVEGAVNRIKFDYAVAYVQRRVPNWLVSDERIAEVIDAALVRAGLGASSYVKKYADLAAGKIGDVRLPTP